MPRLSVGLITTLLVVSVLAPAAVGGATAQDDTVTVTLAVVDANGDPVGNTDLTVTWADGDGGPKNVTTASNGKAFVDVPNGSDITVEINDDDFVRNRPFERNNVRSEEIQVPVAMSGQATISVVGESGSPVPDAEVRVREGSTIETLTTDENGEVMTDRIEQRSESQAYELVVEKPGYFDLESTLTVTGEVNKTVTLRSGTRTLNFRVVDDHFDPPRAIENARVRIPDIGYSSQTFESGETSTSVPVNREYTVQVNKEGYSSAGKRVAVEEESKDVTVQISRANDLTVEATNDRVVVGESTRIRVYDEYDELVPNAQVTVGGENVGRTSQTGEFDVRINSSGNVTIEVSDAGETASVTVQGVEIGEDPSTPTPDPSTPTPVVSTPTPTPDPTTPTPTPEDETTDDETTSGDSGPGFGVAAALAALAAALVLARRR
jgi:PGF-CTERM protein